MTKVNLTQKEVDALLAMEKRCADSTILHYPVFGEKVIAPLVSVDGNERFFLDIWRSKIALGKGTYQNRGRKTLILARLDFGGAPHRNPNGEEIETPHLHLYREGFGDKWAFPVPSNKFSNPSDPRLMLEDFMQYCNIIKQPIIRGLFT